MPTPVPISVPANQWPFFPRLISSFAMSDSEMGCGGYSGPDSSKHSRPQDLRVPTAARFGAECVVMRTRVEQNRRDVALRREPAG